MIMTAAERAGEWLHQCPGRSPASEERLLRPHTENFGSAGCWCRHQWRDGGLDCWASHQCRWATLSSWWTTQMTSQIQNKFTLRMLKIEFLFVSGALWCGQYLLPPRLHWSDSLSESPGSLQADQSPAKKGISSWHLLHVPWLYFSTSGEVRSLCNIFEVALHRPRSPGWETAGWLLECLQSFDRRLRFRLTDHTLRSDQQSDQNTKLPGESCYVDRKA